MAKTKKARRSCTCEKTQLSDFIGVICPTIPPGKRDTGQVLPLIMVIPY